MNLESRMREKSCQWRISSSRATLILGDALTIAREYAEEMCKKQREIYAKEYLKEEKEYPCVNVVQTIQESPLATEAQDGK